MSPIEKAAIGFAIGTAIAVVSTIILAWCAGGWPEVAKIIPGRMRAMEVMNLCCYACGQDFLLQEPDPRRASEVLCADCRAGVRPEVLDGNGLLRPVRERTLRGDRRPSLDGHPTDEDGD